MKRRPMDALLSGLAAALVAGGCTVGQPSRWPREQWQEFHAQLKQDVVRAHRGPAVGICAAETTAGPAQPSEGAETARRDAGDREEDRGGRVDRLRDFDRTWKHDLPWPPVGDYPDEIGPLDDFLVELGYAYLTTREANPRRAYVVFAEHGHRFPRSPRGRIGTVHAQLTIGDLTSAEATLAEWERKSGRGGDGEGGARAGSDTGASDGRPAGRTPASPAAPDGGGSGAVSFPDGSTGAGGASGAAPDSRARYPRAAPTAVEDSSVGGSVLPDPDPEQEAAFVRWLVAYLNCRVSADGASWERGPEKRGAEDLAGARRPVNFLGMEQLKEPPRPGPLSYLGFVLTPVTFFGERFIDLVERDDLPRLPRWPDLGILPGRDRSPGALPRTWYVADFMRHQAHDDADRDRDWKERSARFLACTLRPRWAGQWVPRLHDAPDLGYFPHYASLYALLGRMSLGQDESGRPSLDDLCDALVALLLSSHQEPRDPIVASELCWLWYSVQQRDDPDLGRRQPFLEPGRRFGERVSAWAADLLLKGALPLEDETRRVAEIAAVLERTGASSPGVPFQDDGPLVISTFRVLAALLYQIGPELQQERSSTATLRRTQELVRRMVTQGLGRGEAGGLGAAGIEDRVAADPWRLTPRPPVDGLANAGASSGRAPLLPWHDPIFAEVRGLLESWMAALEAEHRTDPAILARCALVRDRLWRVRH